MWLSCCCEDWSFEGVVYWDTSHFYGRNIQYFEEVTVSDHQLCLIKDGPFVIPFINDWFWSSLNIVIFDFFDTKISTSCAEQGHLRVSNSNSISVFLSAKLESISKDFCEMITRFLGCIQQGNKLCRPHKIMSSESSLVHKWTSSHSTAIEPKHWSSINFEYKEKVAISWVVRMNQSKLFNAALTPPISHFIWCIRLELAMMLVQPDDLRLSTCASNAMFYLLSLVVIAVDKNCGDTVGKCSWPNPLLLLSPTSITTSWLKMQLNNEGWTLAVSKMLCNALHDTMKNLKMQFCHLLQQLENSIGDIAMSLGSSYCAAIMQSQPASQHNIYCHQMVLEWGDNGSGNERILAGSIRSRIAPPEQWGASCQDANWCSFCCMTDNKQLYQ